MTDMYILSLVETWMWCCLCLTVRPSSPTADEAMGKDFKFVLIEKENAPLKKETERLVVTKDTGKQFMSAAPAMASGNTTVNTTENYRQTARGPRAGALSHCCCHVHDTRYVF